MNYPNQPPGQFERVPARRCGAQESTLSEPDV